MLKQPSCFLLTLSYYTWNFVYVITAYSWYLVIGAFSWIHPRRSSQRSISFHEELQKCQFRSITCKTSKPASIRAVKPPQRDNFTKRSSSVCFFVSCFKTKPTRAAPTPLHSQRIFAFPVARLGRLRKEVLEHQILQKYDEPSDLDLWGTHKRSHIRQEHDKFKIVDIETAGNRHALPSSGVSCFMGDSCWISSGAKIMITSANCCLHQSIRSVHLLYYWSAGPSTYLPRAFRYADKSCISYLRSFAWVMSMTLPMATYYHELEK